MSVVSKKIGEKGGYSEASGRYDSVYYSKDREKIESYCKSLERHDFIYYFFKSREKELQKEK